MFPDASLYKLKTELCQLFSTFSPKVHYVVCYFGSYAGKSNVLAEHFVGELVDFVSTIKKNTFNAKLILCEVLFLRGIKKWTAAGMSKRNESVKRINNLIRKYCFEHNVIFLEMNKFVGRKDFGKDGMHLNRKGYYQLSKHIENTVINLMRESTLH